MIENIPSWLKTVSFNIIREYSRKATKSKTLSARIGHGDSTFLVETDSEFVDSQKIEALLAALAQLKPEDEEILVLRLVKGLSWQEISEHLEAKDDAIGRKYSVANLRKRGERALARLKQKYFSY